MASSGSVAVIEANDMGLLALSESVSIDSFFAHLVSYIVPTMYLPLILAIDSGTMTSVDNGYCGISYRIAGNFGEVFNLVIW